MNITVNNQVFQDLWESILHPDNMDDLYSKLNIVEQFIKNGLDINEEYKYNHLIHMYYDNWNYVNTPLKKLLNVYDNIEEPSLEDKMYFEQIFLFLSEKIIPDKVIIELLITDPNLSSIVCEEFIKNYQGEKISFYLNESIEYMELAIGFDLLDTETFIKVPFYKIYEEILPIEAIMVCYSCHYNDNDKWNDEKDSKYKVKLLKYNSPEASLVGMEEYISSINIYVNKAFKRLYSIWNFYISI
jgi:hypothetical protein